MGPEGQARSWAPPLSSWRSCQRSGQQAITLSNSAVTPQDTAAETGAPRSCFVALATRVRPCAVIVASEAEAHALPDQGSSDSQPDHRRRRAVPALNMDYPSENISSCLPL